MNRWIMGLGVLLIVQIVLTILLNTGEDPHAAFTPEEKLATFEPALVDKIHIEAPGEAVILRKEEGKWQLPELDDFPADQQKVTSLLDTLAGLEKGWPVATTSGAAERFKVAKDTFERHIVLRQGEKKVADLYFGTSPGFRRVHARAAGENEIVSVPFSLFDAEADENRWIDRKVLGVQEKEMIRIELPDFVLERDEGEWRLADLKPNEQTVVNEANRLAGKLAGLSIESVFDDETQPEREKDASPLKISVIMKDDKRLDYTFHKLKSGSYLLQRSDMPRRFEVAEWEVRPIRETSREKLVTTKPLPQPETGESEEPEKPVSQTKEMPAEETDEDGSPPENKTSQ